LLLRCIGHRLNYPAFKMLLDCSLASRLNGHSPACSRLGLP
jgi:hypothetical protein